MQLRKIFVGGLSHHTDAVLREYFAPFGAIADVVVMTEGGNGRAASTFEDVEAVTAACVRRFHPIDSRLVEVKPAVPRDVMKR